MVQRNCFKKFKQNHSIGQLYRSTMKRLTRTAPTNAMSSLPSRTNAKVLTFIWCISMLISVGLSSQSSKYGIYMIRQPESTVAPLRDEVLFECALSLKPDGFEWRFQPQSADQIGRNGPNRYIKLSREVNIWAI